MNVSLLFTLGTCISPIHSHSIAAESQISSQIFFMCIQMQYCHSVFPQAGYIILIH